MFYTSAQESLCVLCVMAVNEGRRLTDAGCQDRCPRGVLRERHMIPHRAMHHLSLDPTLEIIAEARRSVFPFCRRDDVEYVEPGVSWEDWLPPWGPGVNWADLV